MTVHVGYPPDTDTPGFAHEAATMVRLLSCPCSLVSLLRTLWFSRDTYC